MAKKHHHASTTAEHVVSATMSLVAERGWRGLALADVAHRADLPLADVVAEFPNRGAILDAYIRQVDQRMLAGSAGDGGDSSRDRLFDTMMRRLEAMAPDRPALRAILRQSCDDPMAIACGLRRFMRSMALTLEAAGISSAGLSGLVKTQVLAALYLNTLRTFLHDEGADLARTMAVLDRALGKAETLAGIVPQCGKRRPAEPGSAHG